MKRWMRRGCVGAALAGSFLFGALAGAGAAGPMDAYRRADAHFQQGQDEDGCRTLAAATPLGPGRLTDDDYRVLTRLARATAAHALSAAREGRRADALQAAGAGMALSRRVMERPDASCRDVREGVALWIIAGEGLEQAWQALGGEDYARSAGRDLALMDRFARAVVLPRCDRPAPSAADERTDAAEARALARLWAWHLVRVAADSIP